MKPIHLLSATLLAFGTAGALAQQSGKVTSTYIGTGTAELDGIAPKPVPLQKLENARKQLTEEQQTINNKRKSTELTPCDEQEIDAREKYAAFMKEHGDQVQEIANQLKTAGLRISRFLREASEGRIGNAPLEEYTDASGQKDRSALIRFQEQGTDGETRTKVIAVKELIKFIQKYEAEIQALPDDVAAIENVVKKYNDPKNETDPEYYNMTLSQAARAFSRNLNSVLALEQTGILSFKLLVGKGKQLFQVSSSISLGYSAKYKTQVGVLSLKEKSEGVSFIEGVRACMDRTRQEDQYWSVIRSQQITINGVPIDGGLRREFFEQLRSNKCKARTYTFDISNSEPGPWLPFESRKPCDKKGIQILSANFEKTSGYRNGSTVKEGRAVNVTDVLAAEANNADVYSTRGTLGDVLSSTGLGYNDGGTLTVRYQCACEGSVREISKHYKLSMAISIGCN